MNHSLISTGAWIFIGSILTVAGCGKKTPEGGGMGDFPMSAVVARAERETVLDTVKLVATLASRDEITLVSELDSTVREVLFVDGQTVNADDELLRLDDMRTRAELAQAKAQARLAEQTYTRNLELLKNQTISQQEFDQAEADFYDRKAALALARDGQSKTRISAPFAGVLGEKMVSVGQFVTRGVEFTRLIRIHPLDAVFDVPERYLVELRTGKEVTFRVDALSGEAVSGKVVYVAPSVDERARTVRVKALVSNEDGHLKPGMFGRLDLVLSRRDHALVIPEASIQFRGDHTQVITVDGSGRAAFNVVQVGQRFKGRVEVVHGLSEGDIVVVEGWQKMGPGSLVMAAPGSIDYGVQPGPLASRSEKAVEEDLNGRL